MKINKTGWTIIAALAIVGIVAVAYFMSNGNKNDSQFQTEPLSRGNLTASVGATGTVRAQQSAVLAWQTSGIVEKVNVRIGDEVKKDQVLANLIQASMAQSVIMAEVDLINAENDLDTLMNSTVGLSQAQLELATAKQAVDDAQDKVDSINYQRASDNLILQTKANIDLAVKEIALAEDNYKRFAKRPDGDVDKAAAMLRLTTARQNYDTLVSNYNWYTGKPTELDIETYNADLALSKAKLADAQREVDRLIGGIPESDIAAINARIAAARSTINMGKVIAPFNGIVTQVDSIPGDMVTPNQLAIRVDDLGKLLIDLQISEVDINNLEIGQAVSVSFDALQGKPYTGIVNKISQYGSSTGTGVNFEVTVELTEVDETIKPGMTAAVNITVREIENALFIQNRSVRNLEGKKVVYVLRDGVAEPVEIRLGSTADNLSEVLGGDIKEGDLIILNPPSPEMNGPFGG